MNRPILISQSGNYYTVIPYAVVMGVVVLGLCTFFIWATGGTSIGAWIACLFLCGLGYLLVRVAFKVPHLHVYLTETHLIEERDGQENFQIPLTSIERVHVPFVQMENMQVATVHYQDATGEKKIFRFMPERYGHVPGRKRIFPTLIYRKKQYYGAEMLDYMAAKAQGKETLDV